jgi:pyrroloquinoline quinone biosynthesis protein B
MRIVILGSAAGGGSPQWNCRCQVCALAWSGDPRVRRRTQTGLGVSVDGMTWSLFDCSPDIREQISSVPLLQPRDGVRDSPVRDIVLTGGDVDHVGGLLSLREGHRFSIHATARIHGILAANPIFDVLDHRVVRREPVGAGTPLMLASGVEIRLFEVPGKVPLYLEDDSVPANARSEATVGIEASAGDKRFFYVPGCAEIDSDVAARLTDANLVFFDGTLWRDDEMIVTGTGTKTGRRMGHIPVGGPDGSLAKLTALGVKRLIYIHVNNTNPMLIEGSPEHAAVSAAGGEVGHDGQEIDP